VKRYLISIVAAVVLIVPVLQAQSLEPPVITITANQYAFSPGGITVRRGEPVTLRVISSERIRGFRSRELGFDVDVRPNQPREITLDPSKTGRFIATGSAAGEIQLTIDVQ